MSYKKVIAVIVGICIAACLPNTCNLTVTIKDKPLADGVCVEYISPVKLSRADSLTNALSALMFEDPACLSKWDNTRAAYWRVTLHLADEYCFGMSNLDLYNGIMQTINVECRYWTDRRAINSISDARGAWQFLPSTRKRLDIPEDVYKMSLVDQAPYVETYIKYKIERHKLFVGDMSSFIDIYLLALAPAYADCGLDQCIIYKNCSYKLALCEYIKKGAGKRCAYHCTTNYDINNDGYVRRWEVRDYIKLHYD